MSKSLRRFLALGSATLTATSLFPVIARATEPLGSPLYESPSMGQVTSVSQLSDIQPTDWAFQALQSLVERYGCIAGYPNGVFRGNRPMTRYEFAAGLNACMDRVTEQISVATSDVARKEDLLTLQNLQEAFSAELTTLRGRVDTLATRTAQLEAQQFSTTTKLNGEAVFGLAAANNDNQAVFQNRVELSLNSSFTGKDLLVTRLAASNAPLFNLKNSTNPDGSAEGRLAYQRDTGNSVNLDTLTYRFPIGKKVGVFIAAVGAKHGDYLLTTANPYLEEGNSGALTFFGQYNPIYYIGGGSGAAVTYKLNPVVGFNLGYLAGGRDDPASPVEGNGIFNGSYAALAQVSAQPLKGKLKVAGTYIHSYHTPGTPIFSRGEGQPGYVGTDFANNPGGLDTAVEANSGGLSVSYQFSPKFVASAWGTYINADIKGGGRNGDIWSYAMAFAFPDLLVKGNLGGLVAGVSPYHGNTSHLIGQPGADNHLPFHFEGFYKVQVNDRISLTPGVVYLLNPNQTNGGKDTVIGTLRTTFTF